MRENNVKIPQPVLEQQEYKNRPFGTERVKEVVRFILDRLADEFDPDVPYPYMLPESSMDVSLVDVRDDGTHIYGTDSVAEFHEIIEFHSLQDDIYGCDGEKDELYSVALNVLHDLCGYVDTDGHTFIFPINNSTLVEK